MHHKTLSWHHPRMAIFKGQGGECTKSRKELEIASEKLKIESFEWAEERRQKILKISELKGSYEKKAIKLLKEEYKHTKVKKELETIKGDILGYKEGTLKAEKEARNEKEWREEQEINCKLATKKQNKARQEVKRNQQRIKQMEEENAELKQQVKQLQAELKAEKEKSQQLYSEKKKHQFEKAKAHEERREHEVKMAKNQVQAL